MCRMIKWHIFSAEITHHNSFKSTKKLVPWNIKGGEFTATEYRRWPWYFLFHSAETSIFGLIWTGFHAQNKAAVVPNFLHWNLLWTKKMCTNKGLVPELIYLVQDYFILLDCFIYIFRGFFTPTSFKLNVPH